MRKYHRWLSVLFGLLILWIGATGLLSQVGALVNNGGFEKEERAAPAPSLVPAARAHEQHALAQPAAAAATPPGFTCPADMTCRPKRVPRPGEWNLGFLHHLHSGEQFGPAGVILSITSGVALLFFAVSGLWMYATMFAKRSRKTHAHGGRFFW